MLSLKKLAFALAQRVSGGLALGDILNGPKYTLGPFNLNHLPHNFGRKLGAIFPFQEHANSMFNSALAYELAVLKPFAEPLLRQVEPGTMTYVEAKRLLAFLEWFLPCQPDPIPDNSILREFVGGSILRDYTP